jgi:drug/metabolite transporter (DMT)-like permease
MTASPHPIRGYLLILVTVLMWSIGPVFVKYFTVYYNVWTQNAFRYGCAALILLAVTGFSGRLRPALRRGQWLRLALVAGVNILMQTVFAATYYFIYPSIASLIIRVNIIFVTVLSFLIFHDERRVIRSPRFLGGAALTLAGVSIVITGRDSALLAHLEVSTRDFWIGAGLALAFAFTNALYSLTIKHAVRSVPPIQSFTHVAWMTTLGLAVPMFALGGVEDLWQAPPSGLLLMAVSAFFCIVIAHTCYYAALRNVKAVVGASILQLVPVSTCVVSALIYGDILNPVQIAGGAAVITGAWLAALAQTRAAPEKPG